jgi:hypothetical protein
MSRRSIVICLTLFLGAMTAAAANDVAPIGGSLDWPGGFVGRLEALAVLETFNADLLSHASATLTLEQWCDSHRLASPPRVVADRVRGVEKPASPEIRRDLGVPASEPVRYRRVRLRCGTMVLSEADNWYVPGRLSSEMNRQLDSTDTPFGKVVQNLHFQRRILSSTLLWRPLAENWDMGGDPAAGADGARLTVPAALLEHRALLTLPDGTALSEVVETYTRNVLAFKAPRN